VFDFIADSSSKFLNSDSEKLFSQVHKLNQDSSALANMNFRTNKGILDDVSELIKNLCII